MNMLNQIILEGTITLVEPAYGSGIFRFELSNRLNSRNPDGLEVAVVSIFNMVANERFAPMCKKWLTLGRLVRIVGHLSNCTWVTKDGAHRDTYVVVEHIEFLKRSE